MQLFQSRLVRLFENRQRRSGLEFVVSERRAVEPSGCVRQAHPAVKTVLVSPLNSALLDLNQKCYWTNTVFCWDVRTFREPVPVLQQSVFGRQPKQCQGGGSCHGVDLILNHL